MAVRGFMDQELTPLMASQLAAALMEAVRVHGDLPVRVASPYTYDGSEAAAYLYPYGADGNEPTESGAAYFYIHGTLIDKDDEEPN